MNLEAQLILWETTAEPLMCFDSTLYDLGHLLLPVLHLQKYSTVTTHCNTASLTSFMDFRTSPASLLRPAFPPAPPARVDFVVAHCREDLAWLSKRLTRVPPGARPTGDLHGRKSDAKRGLRGKAKAVIAEVAYSMFFTKKVGVRTADFTRMRRSLPQQRIQRFFGHQDVGEDGMDWLH